MTDSDAHAPRCGYPTKDGKPCRNRVPAEGKVCKMHVKAALLDRLLSSGRRAEGAGDQPTPKG